MGNIEHWWCRECGTFNGPKGDDDCTVCFDHDGNYVKVEYLVPSTTHRGAVDSAVAQTRSLMDAIERDLNDVGPWGNGYRQALADLREQLTLRFGGQ